MLVKLKLCYNTISSISISLYFKNNGSINKIINHLKSKLTLKEIIK